VWAIVSVFVVGLGALIGLMAVMNEGAGFNPIVLVAAMLSFALMLVVEGVLIWLLLSGRRGAGKAGDARRLKEHTTKELEEARARALPAPAASVTEHTTRTFDPVYNERKSG
jgi:hypothetical protein